MPKKAKKTEPKPKKKKDYPSKTDSAPILIEEEHVSAPDANQEEAIAHTNGPLLVVAGAGTGKTRVITERIARLINNKTCEPSEIIALTFSEKAAREMERRVDSLVAYGMIETHISTFHSFGNDIITENFAELKIAPDWKLLTEPDAIILIVENMDRFKLDIYRPLNNPARYVRELVKFVSKLKDNLIAPAEYVKYAEQKMASAKCQAPNEKQTDGELSPEAMMEDAEKHAELARFYEEYEKLKTEKNLMDHGDQIMVPYMLFREKKSVLERYRQKYKYILVDEFQDTNHAQFEMVKLLAGGHRNICVVGDDDQMIYRFRGAAISNIMGFRNFYPDTKIVLLKNNYRSCQDVLDAAYKVIQNNTDRLEVKLNIEKRLVSKYKPEFAQHGTSVKLFGNYSEEADFAADETEKLVKSGKCGLKDIAILVRSKNDAGIFIKTFERRGIPFVFSGDEGLFNKKEVQFLINFCRVIVTPYEFNPLFDVAVSEVYNIDPFVLSKAGNRAKDYSITAFDLLSSIGAYPEIEAPEEEKDRITAFITDIKHYAALIAEGWRAGEILYDFVKSKRMIETRLREATLESEQEIANISRLFEIIKQFSVSEEYDTVHNFVRYIDLKQKAGENPKADLLSDFEEDALNIMTIHKAKGLEFKVVFMVALVQDKFPVRDRQQSPFPMPEELMKDLVDEKTYAREEERRLFYVAMTRSQERLFLTASRQYDGVSLRKLSVFLRELGVTDREEDIRAAAAADALKYFEKKQGAIERAAPAVKKGGVILSNYQIDDYLTCPYKYKLIHVLKMPIREQPNVIYGQAMHRVAAEFFKARQEKKEATLDELKSIFTALWKPVGFISREHEKMRYERGLRTIEEFYNKEKHGHDVPEFIEKDFEFKLASDVSVIGRWDRIDNVNGKSRILDYKTSDIKDEEKAKKKLSDPSIAHQLTLYALAYEKMFGKPVDEVGVYFIESRIVSVKKLRPDTIKNYSETILETAGGIKHRRFDATPSSHTCSSCAFFNICPYSKAEVLF